jgi:hypothetical protein
MVGTQKDKGVSDNGYWSKKKRSKKAITSSIEKNDYKIIQLNPGEPILFEYDTNHKKYEVRDTANNDNSNNILLIVPK